MLQILWLGFGAVSVATAVRVGHTLVLRGMAGRRGAAAHGSPAVSRLEVLGPGMRGRPGVDLYWIPLGAGAHLVRMSGTIYEAVSARIERRARCRLYHSALVAVTGEGRFVIEMTEIRDARGKERGVGAEGSVGTARAGRIRIFRYEVRRWHDGVIPDLAAAVQSPVTITDDAATAGRLVELVPLVPTLVWGRDELRTGDMWNSNSVTAWLLATAGLDVAAVRPPPGGRAPGWDAGLAAARRPARPLARKAAA